MLSSISATHISQDKKNSFEISDAPVIQQINSQFYNVSGSQPVDLTQTPSVSARILPSLSIKEQQHRIFQSSLMHLQQQVVLQEDRMTKQLDLMNTSLEAPLNQAITQTQ